MSRLGCSTVKSLRTEGNRGHQLPHRNGVYSETNRSERLYSLKRRATVVTRLRQATYGHPVRREKRAVPVDHFFDNPHFPPKESWPLCFRGHSCENTHASIFSWGWEIPWNSLEFYHGKIQACADSRRADDGTENVMLVA